MEQGITNKESDRSTNIRGEIRGFVIKGCLDFIIKKKGKEDLKRLEEELIKRGYPFRYKDIKKFAFYPLRLLFLILDIIVKLFSFGDKEFQEMGSFQAQILISPATKTLIYFFSAKFFDKTKIMREISKQWKTGATVGSIKVIEFDEKKRYAIFRIEDFFHHPAQCQACKGFLIGLTNKILGSTNTICEETKCIHRGDDYHEFLLKWEKTSFNIVQSQAP